MKLVREHINEKFTDESDTIKDMNIGMMSAIKKFLEKTPDNIFDANDKNDLLVSCAKYSKTDYVKYLIENGANIHAYGEAALGWAVIKNNIELVKYFIDKGSNVNIDLAGQSPLTHAFFNKNEEMIKLLKDAGAVELSDKEKMKKLKKFGRDAWKIQQK